jgi:hypothetical protein
MVKYGSVDRKRESIVMVETLDKIRHLDWALPVQFHSKIGTHFGSRDGCFVGRKTISGNALDVAEGFDGWW